MAPSNEEASSPLRLFTTFGVWWWRRWSQPRNPYLASASVVVWVAVLIVGLWFRDWMLASSETDVIEHRNEVLPLLTWLLLVAVSAIYMSLAFAVRAREVEIVGLRRKTFLVLTVAGNTVMLIDILYFWAVVHPR